VDGFGFGFGLVRGFELKCLNKWTVAVALPSVASCELLEGCDVY
jgi:hypothetical protein